MKKFLPLLALLVLCACAYRQTDVTLPDGFTLHVRIADTPEKTEKGLMFVKHLPQTEGMLFVFDQEQEHFFWMKNTLIDLDIIFLDAQRRITRIYSNVPHTYTYTPEYEVPVVNGQAQYVLETAAGVAEKHGLKEADTVEFVL